MATLCKVCNLTESSEFGLCSLLSLLSTGLSTPPEMKDSLLAEKRHCYKQGF